MRAFSDFPRKLARMKLTCNTVDEEQLCDGSRTNSGEDDKEEEDSEVNITGEVLFNL